MYLYHFIFGFVGGGSVCFWSGFSYNGRLRIVKTGNNLNAKGYQNIIQNNLIGNGENITLNGSSRYIFQQDNASIHTAKSTYDFFGQFENIILLDWPSKSPDLNPIENLWGILARRVYAYGTQYDSIEDLEESVYRCWDTIENEILESLIDSMPNRIGNVLVNNGKNTRY